MPKKENTLVSNTISPLSAGLPHCIHQSFNMQSCFIGKLTRSIPFRVPLDHCDVTNVGQEKMRRRARKVSAAADYGNGHLDKNGPANQITFAILIIWQSSHQWCVVAIGVQPWC